MFIFHHAALFFAAGLLHLNLAVALVIVRRPTQPCESAEPVTLGNEQPMTDSSALAC